MKIGKRVSAAEEICTALYGSHNRKAHNSDVIPVKLAATGLLKEAENGRKSQEFQHIRVIGKHRHGGRVGT